MEIILIKTQRGCLEEADIYRKKEENNIVFIVYDFYCGTLNWAITLFIPNSSVRCSFHKWAAL